MRKRGIPILVRLNVQEQQSLAKQVKKSGLSQEAFIRALINGYVPKELPSSRLLFNDAGASCHRQQFKSDCGKG